MSTKRGKKTPPGKALGGPSVFLLASTLVEGPSRTRSANTKKVGTNIVGGAGFVVPARSAAASTMGGKMKVTVDVSELIWLPGFAETPTAPNTAART